MTQPSAIVPIQITADDKTAKGAKSAEKRLGQIPRHVSAVNRRWADEADRSVARTSRGVLRTFASVEQAGARAFGGRSMSSGLVSRVGALREATSALGTGMGEAATSGGILAQAVTTVGVAAAGTIGIVAAAGYAAFKLADGWAQGAASIGRTAQTIGIATKALQEFTAAGERAGVDKGASTSALGGMAQTFNDARYGRNQEALALMMRLGIKPRVGADGQLDTMGMSMDLADALKRQKNAQTRRMIAGKFGISDAALPMFADGSASLRADMADADKTALVLSDADVAKGKRIARKGAIVGQMKDRAMSAAGSAAADATESGYDAVISGGRSALENGGRLVEQGGRAIERAATRMWDAARRGAADIGHGVIGAAQAAARNWGIPASITLGQYALESSFGRRMPAGSNNPFGIKARAGDPYVTARTREVDKHGRSYWTMARFRKFDSIEEAFDEHGKLLASGRYAGARRQLPSVDRFADALTGVYATDPKYGGKLRNIIHGNGYDRYDEIPVKVEVTVPHAPPGTRAKVTAGRRAVAISHAPVGRV